MTKLFHVVSMCVLGLVVLGATGPTVTHLVGALVPLVLVVGFLAAVLELVRFYTRGRL